MPMLSLLIFVIVRIILIGSVKPARIIFIILITFRIIDHPSSKGGRSGGSARILFINNTPRSKDNLKKKERKINWLKGSRFQNNG